MSVGPGWLVVTCGGGHRNNAVDVRAGRPRLRVRKELHLTAAELY